MMGAARGADLKDGLGSVALDVVAVGDNLQHAVPHLLTHVVPRDADEVEDGVHIPAVVHGILLSQDGHLQDLPAGREGQHV